MTLNWQHIRSEFPATAKFTFLNAAGKGPVCRPAAEAGSAYYLQALEVGNTLWDEWLQEVERTRQAAAALLGAAPRNIAFLPNTSTGMNLIAGFFPTTAEVLMPSDEFPSSSLPWMQQGFPVRFIGSGNKGLLPAANLLNHIGPHTQIIMTSHVQYSTGFRQDLESIGKACKDHGLAFVVDATQSAGVVPLDVVRSNIDFVVFSGYKWLSAGCGIAVLYIADRFLDSTLFPAAGWRSSKAPDKMINDRLDLTNTAQALELGHPQFPNILALGGALKLVEAIGVPTIETRVNELTDYFHQKLSALGIEILSPKQKAQRAGITMLAAKNAKSLVRQLEQKKIIVAARGKGVRVSLHHYNNQDDIDRFVDEYGKIKSCE